MLTVDVSNDVGVHNVLVLPVTSPLLPLLLICLPARGLLNSLLSIIIIS